MKKIIFPLLFLFAFIQANAQNKTIPGSFVIKNLNDNSKLEFYTKAIENANFEELRLKNKSRVFEFENGFFLELISATELKKTVISVDNNSYAEEVSNEFQTPLFKISQDGGLVSMYQSQPTKNEQKINSTK